MRANIRKFLAISGAVLSLAGPANAHRAWMMPSTFTLSGEDQRITVDAAISNNLFYPNHHALSLDGIEVTGPDGAPVGIENAATGEYRSVFDVPLRQQGTYKIASGGAGYFASWEENGERRRWRGSLEELEVEGIAGKPGVTISKSVRRVETFVTLGAPSETVFAAEGEGLELQPVTHPNDVFAGEEASFVLLLNGEPAEGVEVEIIRGHDRYRDSENAAKLVTGADGSFSFTPQEAGPYWLSAEAEGEAELDGQMIGERVSYVMTFEALPF